MIFASVRGTLTTESVINCLREHQHRDSILLSSCIERIPLTTLLCRMYGPGLISGSHVEFLNFETFAHQSEIHSSQIV